MEFGDEFRGKAMILTGACGVIGRWLAEAFARRGARLMLSDVRADALSELAEELGDRFGAEALTHATELTDDASTQALVDAAVAAWGAPDVLINNAGVYPSGFLLDIGAAEWDRILGVNLRAPFVLTRAVARAMIAAGKGGAVVNISSGAARKMRSTVVPYCVSKTALDRLTKGFALELAEFGIRVNAVEPGFAPGSAASPLTEAHVAATAAGVPLGRVSGPEDAANAVLYLCSAAAAYVTGATLAVDGGNSIGSTVVHQDKKRPL